MLPTKFRIIWPSGYRREEFFKSANQKQELPVAAMFVNGSGRNLSVIQFIVSIYKLELSPFPHNNRFFFS
jgi:hypothetical protein